MDNSIIKSAPQVQNNSEDDSTDVIEFDENIEWVRAYTWLPYSPQRIKQLMWEKYGIELEWIHPGYKGGRYPGYRRSYVMRWADTGEIINPRIKLEQLRYFLAREGHPLYDPKVKRHYGCARFMEVLEQLKEDASHE